MYGTPQFGMLTIASPGEATGANSGISGANATSRSAAVPGVMIVLSVMAGAKAASTSVAVAGVSVVSIAAVGANVDRVRDAVVGVTV